MNIRITMIIKLGLFVTSFSVGPSSYGQKVKLAVSQFLIEGDQTNEELVNKIETAVTRAAKEKANIVVLPEWITLDRWPSSTKKSDRQIVQDIASQTNETYLRTLKGLASKHNLVLIGGSTGLVENGKLFNAAPVVLPNGKIVFHKKVHLTDWERKQGLVAGDQATVVETPYGKIAVLTCFDVEFPDLSLQLMKQRPEIVIVPSMTESEAGQGRVRWSAQARVVEQTAYAAVAVTAGKTAEDWHHYGKAVILGPQLPGFEPVVAEGDGKTHGLTFGVIDLGLLRSQRKTSVWQPAVYLNNR